MIGQQAAALLVGDAKQRSALYAFLRDPFIIELALPAFVKMLDDQSTPLYKRMVHEDDWPSSKWPSAVTKQLTPRVKAVGVGGDADESKLLLAARG
jgi:hypothetical protein